MALVLERFFVVIQISCVSKFLNDRFPLIRRQSWMVQDWVRIDRWMLLGPCPGASLPCEVDLDGWVQ